MKSLQKELNLIENKIRKEKDVPVFFPPSQKERIKFDLFVFMLSP